MDGRQRGQVEPLVGELGGDKHLDLAGPDVGKHLLALLALADHRHRVRDELGQRLRVVDAAGQHQLREVAVLGHHARDEGVALLQATQGLDDGRKVARGAKEGCADLHDLRRHRQPNAAEVVGRDLIPGRPKPGVHCRRPPVITLRCRRQPVHALGRHVLKDVAEGLRRRVVGLVDDDGGKARRPQVWPHFGQRLHGCHQQAMANRERAAQGLAEGLGPKAVADVTLGHALLEPAGPLGGQVLRVDDDQRRALEVVVEHLVEPDANLSLAPAAGGHHDAAVVRGEGVDSPPLVVH